MAWVKYNTDDFPIKLKYWYIVSFGDFTNLTLYPVYFVNKVAAKRALSLHVSTRNRARYEILSGRKLREFKLTYTIYLGSLGRFTKYAYPPEVKNRKNYRTVMRRRLRRMGMLVLVKPKLHIQKKSKYNTLIHNTQAVANIRKKAAVVFKVERKPQRFRYVILKKEISNTRQILFKIRAIRVNLKDKSYKVVNINIRNNDVLTPYIIQELLNRVKNTKTHERLLKYCAKRSIPLYPRTQKNFQ